MFFKKLKKGFNDLLGAPPPISKGEEGEENEEEAENEKPTRLDIKILVAIGLFLVIVLASLINLFDLVSGGNAPSGSEAEVAESAMVNQGEPPGITESEGEFSNLNEGEERPSYESPQQVQPVEPERLTDRQEALRRENPYERRPQQPAGNARDAQVQELKASLRNVREGVNSFDPAGMGPPRNPESGRPIGQPQTMSDFEREMMEGGENPPSIYQPPEEESASEEFLRRVEEQGGGAANINEVRGPLSQFVIPQGTIIPIALESRVNSDLPGTVRAIVTADVYDRSKQHVLIPKGSQIVNDYGEVSQVGQRRLLVAATRLNLPDGRYINFRDARATGPTGEAGLEDVRNRHLFSRFSSVGALAVLSTIVNANDILGGLGASQQDTTASGEVVVVPGGGGFRAGFQTSFLGQVNRVIGELLERQIDRSPTLKLRPGLQGQLILNEDIDLERPYYEHGDDFDRIDRENERYQRERSLRRAGRVVQRSREWGEAEATMRGLRQQYDESVNHRIEGQAGQHYSPPRRPSSGAQRQSVPQGVRSPSRHSAPQEPFLRAPYGQTPRQQQIMEGAPPRPSGQH